MSDQDLLHRFVFDNCDFRGEVVTLGESYRQVLHNHPYPEGVRQLLGECLAAAALLSSSLKFNGRISIQAKGEGRRAGEPADGRVQPSSGPARYRAVARGRGTNPGARPG